LINAPLNHAGGGDKEERLNNGNGSQPVWTRLRSSDFYRRVPEQIRRLSVVIFLLLAAFLGAFYVLPAGLTDTDLQKRSTIAIEAAKPIHFAGSAACADCHEDESTKKRSGYHKTLSCETCHGPAAAHVEDPTKTKPFVPKERKVCPVCHDYNLSRPTGFPQINPTLHNPLQSCASCHSPHDPVPPKTPTECSACHNAILRTKNVSSHALVPCLGCHTVPDQHKVTPRIVKATKPETREACGVCHKKGATASSAPKIDLVTHGERYVCWQCHYPHLPAERS
jgi:hypothetical protein